MGHRPTLIEITRAEKDLTVGDLAAIAGVDRRTLTAVEKREKRIAMRQLVRITKALELDIREVLADLGPLYGAEEVAS